MATAAARVPGGGGHGNRERAGEVVTCGKKRMRGAARGDGRRLGRERAEREEERRRRNGGG